MTKHLYFKQLAGLFCFLLLCVFQSHAQEEQVIEKQAFTSQIGVDFASFLRGEQGLSLMYKQAIPGGLGIFKQHQKALRIGAGFYNENVNNASLSGFRGDTVITREYSGKSKVQFLRFGVENQINRKKWRFHFGGDLGFRYGTTNGKHQTLERFSNEAVISNETKSSSRDRAVEVSFLAGISYFIIPRLSVGIEANYSAARDFSSITSTDSNGVTSNYSNAIFEFGIQPWRLLLLSYHFGQPKQK